MYLEVKLSGSDAVKNEAKGRFAITQDAYIYYNGFNL